ncbi:hypothetical protein [Kangiella sp. M94]
MSSIIKVVIGIIVGVTGFWALDRYVEEGDNKAQQDTKIEQEVSLSGKNESRTPNNKLSNAKEKDEAGEVESLTNELESLKREMEIKNQELMASKLESKRLNAILKGDGTSLDGLTAEQTPSNDRSSSVQNKFEGIPESHHSLLSRPESMPKETYELHDDFVNEPEDISWATLKEQQINHFLMNHKDSSQFIVHVVECRSTMCEIVGTQFLSDKDLWSDITQQMRKQAWWDFRGSHTTGTPDGNGNGLFATILRRAPDNEKES